MFQHHDFLNENLSGETSLKKRMYVHNFMYRLRAPYALGILTQLTGVEPNYIYDDHAFSDVEPPIVLWQ